MQHLTAFSKKFGTSNNCLRNLSAKEKVRVIEYGYSNLRIAVIAYIICGEREQGKERETVFCKLKRDAPQPWLEQTSTQCQMPKTRTQYSKKAVPSDFTAIFDLFECPKNNICSYTKNIWQIAFISASHGFVAIKNSRVSCQEYDQKLAFNNSVILNIKSSSKFQWNESQIFLLN